MSHGYTAPKANKEVRDIQTLVGLTITGVAVIPWDEEQEKGVVVELSDGSFLYTARDEERNGPGDLCSGKGRTHKTVRFIQPAA